MGFSRQEYWSGVPLPETPGVTGKFGLGIWNEAGQRLIEFCQENALVCNPAHISLFKSQGTIHPEGVPFPKFCMCSNSPFTPRPRAHLHIYVCVHMLRLHAVQATSIYAHSCITCKVHGHPQAQNLFLTRLTPRGPGTDLSACPSLRLKVMPSAPIPVPAPHTEEDRERAHV